VRKPPPRAPEWAHQAYKLVRAGAGIKSAAKEVRRPRDAIRYWLQPRRREQSRAAAARYEARRAADPATRRCRCGRVLSEKNRGGVCLRCLQGDPAERAEKDERLVRMWRAGASMREITEVLERSEAYIAGRLKKLRGLGVTLPLRGGGPVAQYDRRRLVELWNLGAPSRAIAAELGMNARVVPVIVSSLRSNGWPVARRFRSRPEWIALAPRLERMWADGVQRREIAHRLGVRGARALPSWLPVGPRRPAWLLHLPRERPAQGRARRDRRPGAERIAPAADPRRGPGRRHASPGAPGSSGVRPARPSAEHQAWEV
jgi:transposase-like protein